MLVLAVGSQGLRWWCIRTLGPRWNTRVIVVPGLPLVDSGPYRWFAHPNYVAVVVEGFALPLAGSAWVTALVFTVLNAALLTVRLRCEIRALARPESRVDGRAVLDVLIVGGGPIGLATACYAAEAGLTAVVAEPRTGPIDKACGEGLMPPAVAALRALGVDPAGRELRGIRYRDAGHSVDAEFRGGPGRGVRRTVLHEALAKRAEAAGSKWFRVRVTEFWQLAGRRGGLGHHGALPRGRRRSALPRPPRLRAGSGAPSRHARYGLRRHFQIAPWTDFVEVHWSAGVGGLRDAGRRRPGRRRDPRTARRRLRGPAGSVPGAARPARGGRGRRSGARRRTAAAGGAAAGRAGRTGPAGRRRLRLRRRADRRGHQRRAGSGAGARGVPGRRTPRATTSASGAGSRGARTC